MSISFESLAHYPHFRDGLEFFDDLKDWALTYETRTMVPDKWNHKLANETTAILLYDVPKSMKPFGKHVVSTLMDDRLRKAMMLVVNTFFLLLLLFSDLMLISR